MTTASKSRSSKSAPEPPRLDLNLLSVFDVVMTERHVTRAAERLQMTQSAVSNALNRLRRQLQDQLFVKSARGVAPTPRALALWPRIHLAVEELNDTVRPKVFDATHAALQFRLAMADITASLLAPHLYRNVQDYAPRTTLFFLPDDPALTGPRLMRGEVDFAIGIAPPRAAVIETMPLWSDTFVVAARRGHPLLKRKVSLAAFCEAPQVVINESGDEDKQDMIDTALSDRGLARNVRLTLNQFSVVAKVLRNSELIAVLPARFVMPPGGQEDIAFQPLPFDLPKVVVHLSWHRRSDSHLAHQWLKQRLLEAATALNVETEFQ